MNKNEFSEKEIIETKWWYNLLIYHYKWYDFIFDKSYILIWVLIDWEAINDNLYNELMKRFDDNELFDYLESLEKVQLFDLWKYKDLYDEDFKEWEEKFAYYE